MSNKINITIDEDLKDLIPHFLDNRNEDIAVISVSLEKKEFKAIESIAHKLSGNAGSYGFIELGLIGQAMEQAAKENNFETTSQEFEKMKTYLKNLDISYGEVS